MTSPGGQEVGRISIRVVPDTHRFRSELRAQLEEIENSMKATIPVDVDLDTAGAKAHMRTLLAELKAQAANGIDINTNIDRDRVGQLASEFTKAGEGAAFAGQQFAGMTRMGWLVVGVMAAAAPAVGLVAGLLAGLPSLIGAFGAGAGAVALGLDGIKAAAASVQPEFDALKASVSSVFEKGLTAQFDQLKALFPTLTAGMGQVAQGLLNMGQGFVNVVTSAQGMNQISNILNQTGNFFASLQPAIQAGTQSFLTLANAGANAFSLLSGPLNTFATQFNDMVNRITSNGAFQGAMQGLSQVLGSVLNLFTRLFESGVNAMGQLGGPLTTLINGLGDALVALMPALTTFSSFIAQVGGTLLSSLAPAVQALTPAFTQFANMLGGTLTSALQTLSPLLTQVAGAIGQALLTSLQTVAPLLPQVLTAFQQMVNVLVTQLGPVLPTVATAFGQLLGALSQVGPTIFIALAQAFVQLAPALAQAAPAAAQLAVAFSQLLTAITPMIPQIIQASLHVIGFAQILSGIVVGGITAVSGAISDVIGTIQDWVSSFQQAVANIVSEAQSLGGKIASACGNFGSILIGAGKALMDGLLSGIKAGLASVLSFAAGIAAKIAAVKGPLPKDRTTLTPNGQALMQGLQDGIEGGLQGVLDRARQIAGEISDAINSGASGVNLGALPDQLKKSLDEIDLEKKQLKVQADATTDKGEKKSLKDQIAQLQTMRDQLSLQSEQLGFSKKYGDETDQTAKSQQMVTDSISKIVDIGKNFAMANVTQFEQDLGISGNGAIPQVADQLLNWGLGLIPKLIGGGGDTYNVSSADDAIAIKNNKVNRQAIGVVGR